MAGYSYVIEIFINIFLWFIIFLSAGKIKTEPGEMIQKQKKHSAADEDEEETLRSRAAAEDEIQVENSKILSLIPPKICHWTLVVSAQDILIRINPAVLGVIFAWLSLFF